MNLHFDVCMLPSVKIQDGVGVSQTTYGKVKCPDPQDAMIKSPCHGQTSYVKYPAYARPPPLRLNIDRCIIVNKKSTVVFYRLFTRMTS